MKRYIYKREDGSYSEVDPEITSRISPQPHWIEIPKGAECFAVWEDDIGCESFYKESFKWVFSLSDGYWESCVKMSIDHIYKHGGKIVWVEKGFEKLLEGNKQKTLMEVFKNLPEVSQQEVTKPKYLAENTQLFINGVEIPCVEDFKFEPPKCHPLEDKPFNPLDVQEGGSHYKQRGIQPIEYTEANKLNFQQGNVVKYITRHKEKNGVEDLGKVVHYALLEAYFTYGVEGSTKLKQKIIKMLGESN